MSDFRRLCMRRVVMCATVCLGFTGSHVAWADPAQMDPLQAQADAPQTEPPLTGPPAPDLYVEDPYAPHQTSGSEARLGTMVGFLYGLPQPVTELGVVAAGGQRFGRLAIEAEASYFALLAEGEYKTPLGLTEGDVGVGHGERLGALVRYDVFRAGSHFAGANTLFAAYVEAGPAVEWVQFTAPVDQMGLLKPDNTRRIEGQIGFGIVLDHRLQEPIGFPHRIAWFLGWRLAMSPHQALMTTECRTTTVCERVEMPEPADGPPAIDRSMLFQSSLAFTF